MTGIRLVQRLTTSPPTVITLKFATVKETMAITRGTGGLVATRTDPLNQLPPEKLKETGLKELLRLHTSPSRANTSRF